MATVASRYPCRRTAGRRRSRKANGQTRAPVTVASGRHHVWQARIEHPEPARDEEDRRLGHHHEAGPFEHRPQGAARIGLLESIGVEPDGLKGGGEERTEERVVTVRHADDGASARLEHTDHLPDGAFGLVEVLDRAHGVDGLEARVTEGQIADVGHRAAQTVRPAFEGGARLDHGGLRDVDAVDAGALPAGPGQDARVPGFVPQIGLEEPQALQGREVLREEAAFVVRVVAGRGRPAEVGEPAAHLRPEAPIGLRPRHAGSLPRTLPPQWPSHVVLGYPQSLTTERTLAGRPATRARDARPPTAPPRRESPGIPRRLRPTRSRRARRR